MAFPTDPLGTRVELQIGDAWTDETPDVYLEDGITITRGRRDAGARVDPGQCTLTFKNRSGKYSPRNPLSPYYGLLGRNTPVRVSVAEGPRYLALDGTPTGIASTPDHASLDLTGDLDLRVEASIDWHHPTRNQVLLAKWDGPGNQRSYSLRVFGDLLVLNWTADGTSQFTGAFSLAGTGIPERAAVRATLDVDDGAGQLRVDAYWAVSLDGPWLQFGGLTGSVGTTSVHAGTAPLTIGVHDPTVSPPRTPPTGRVHRAEVRAGIDGPAVAAPDFRTQPLGTAGFTDSAGRPWTVNAPAALASRQTRFLGEVSSWPARWGVTGQIVRVPIEAAGILRRLGQGRKPLDSTLRRRIPSDPGLLAYWPMEEGEGATRAYSPVPGVRPMTTSGLRFAADDTLPGSSPLPVLATGASFSGAVPRGTSTTGWQVEFAYRLEALPAAAATMIAVTLAGSPVRTVRVRPSTAAIRIEALDAEDALIASASYSNPPALAEFVGGWNRLRIRAAVSGGSTDLFASWFGVTAPTGWFVQTTFTGAPGNVAGVGSTVAAAFDGVPIGHVGVFDTSLTSIYDGADDGFAGESATTRMARLTVEEGYPLVLADGDPALLSERVGPQRPEATLDLVEAAADVDGGILGEARDQLALRYRDRHTLYNQAPRLVLDYGGPGEVAPPLEPVDDDDAVRNDVTVTREGGSSGRAELTEGPLSVQAPPEGVGRYDESVTLGLYDDGQPAQHAGWRLHLGTWDGTRYPAVRVDLARAPHLIDAATSVDIGDRIQVLHPPPWLPPDAIDQLVQGYTERIGVRTWDIEVACTPAGPWNTGVVDDGTYGYVDTDGSALAAAVSDTTTALAVVTTADAPQWSINCTDTPFPVRVGGEIMTVTDIADGVLDTFTRTVSSGWGSTDDGHAWTTSGGAASAYSASSGKGRVSVSAVNSSRFCLLAAASPVFDFAATVETDVLAAGGSHYPQLVGRWLDTSNYYSVRLALNTDQSVTLSLRRRVAGTETELASADLAGLTHAANRQFSVRFWGNGPTLRARAWLASEPEPELTWHLEAEDTALTAAGSLGLRAILSSANTNPLPVTVTADDLIVYNPQVMTVTRAVNGIVKGHPAGSDIRLAHPAIVAL